MRTSFSKLTKEEKQELLKQEMVRTKVPAISYDSYFTLLDLCEKIGIKTRVQYFNMIERPVNSLFEVRKIVHDYGLIFNNGIEITHVKKEVFKLYPDIEIKEIRKRIN